MIYIVIYQHWDGYLAMVGRTLATFLKSVKVVNGFDLAAVASYNEGDIICNGFGDVVAQFIQKHKEIKEVPFDFPPAAFCIYPAVSGQREEYTYYVTYEKVNNVFTVKVDSVHDDEQYEEMSLVQFEHLCNVKYIEDVLRFLSPHDYHQLDHELED